MKHTLPGASILKIGLKDYDPGLTDDFIGETEIDIERRFFDDRWSNLPHYPIETRFLRKKESKTATGKIRLWIEVFEESAARKRQEDFEKGYSRGTQASKVDYTNMVIGFIISRTRFQRSKILTITS